MSEQVKQLYKFGAFTLDLKKRLLWSNGTLVPLAPKLAETLVLLVEREGDVVEKQELLSRVWPDTIVEENSLAQNISTLRKTLGFGQDEHQYIETVAKRGYRFVNDPRRPISSNGGQPEAPVREVGAGKTRSQTVRESLKAELRHYSLTLQVSRRQLLIFLPLLAISVLGISIYWFQSQRRNARSTGTAASDLPIVGIHPKWYDFEDGAEGWISKSSGMITKLASSDAHSYKGHRSLAITFAGPFKPKTQVYVVPPQIPPGDFIMAHIWCPRDNNLTSIALFVEEGNGSWDNDWQGKAVIVPASWNGFRVLLPTDAVTPLRRVGVEFTSHSAWTGTCYLDSVEWVPSW